MLIVNTFFYICKLFNKRLQGQFVMTSHNSMRKCIYKCGINLTTFTKNQLIQK